MQVDLGELRGLIYQQRTRAVRSAANLCPFSRDTGATDLRPDRPAALHPGRKLPRHPARHRGLSIFEPDMKPNRGYDEVMIVNPYDPQIHQPADQTYEIPSITRNGLLRIATRDWLLRRSRRDGLLRRAARSMAITASRLAMAIPTAITLSRPRWVGMRSRRKMGYYGEPAGYGYYGEPSAMGYYGEPDPTYGYYAEPEMGYYGEAPEMGHY